MPDWDRFQAQLDRVADRIALWTLINRAIRRAEKRMSLSDKLATLAQRAKAVPAALEARADALAPRLEAAERVGNAAFDGLEVHVADIEAGVAATENAVRMISNAPLPGSVTSSNGSGDAQKKTQASGS